jgi:tRNA(fMet)-specific endonuclease VapC
VINHLNHIERLTRRLEELAPAGLTLSIISLAELYEGVLFPDPVESEDALPPCLNPALTILDMNEETCRIFGKERSRLQAARLMIRDCDLLIGVTALHHNLTLLTSNHRHCERIEGLRMKSA